MALSLAGFLRVGPNCGLRRNIRQTAAPCRLICHYSDRDGHTDLPNDFAFFGRDV
jgi:hypothetical protein